MMFDPHQLAALRSVLRLGSFAAAARALHVTPSAISQRIKALEEHVGGSLVQRGQPCRGTPAGVRLAKHAEDVLLLEEHVSRALALSPTEVVPRLRVALNADSLATWFIDAMAGADPLLFDLVLDDENHSATWLRRGEVSAAVTASAEPVAGCDLERLGTMRYLAITSPGFVERWFPDGVDAAAIAAAPCLTFDAKDALQRQWIARFLGPDLDPPSHFVPSTQGFLDAARAGLGWGLNPLPLVAPHLEDGSLVPLLPDAPLDVVLHWQVSRIMAPALAPVTASVLAAAARVLRP